MPPQHSVWAQQLRDLSDTLWGANKLIHSLKKNNILFTYCNFTEFLYLDYVYQITQAEKVDQKDLVFFLNIILQ